MARKFFVNNKIENTFIELYDEEYNHIVNVSRKKLDDEIVVFDGFGKDYIAKIIGINKKSVKLEILKVLEGNSETKANVTVYQALVKNDKLELIIQKLTELGIKRFVPFVSSYCQVKANTTRIDRLEKISIEALKQCGRSKIVEIDKVKSFNEILSELKKFDKVVFAYENSKQNLKQADLINCKNVAIVIGSEGGFSEEENEKLSSLENVLNISLGNRIMRAETASISLTSVVMFLMGEWMVI